MLMAVPEETRKRRRLGETGLRRAVLERVRDMLPSRVATSVRRWCERDGDVGLSR